MLVKEVNFLKSVSINSKEVFFDNYKEIVFVGRSNVGKSSLMNYLFSSKDLVKTSSTPGKTKTANIFRVNKKNYFTDLPGYGFAKLGNEFREHLDALISWYLDERKAYIKSVVILIDSRIGAQEVDKEMYKFILELDLPILIVLSKTDKLSNNELSSCIRQTEKDFFGQDIISVSSTKRLGITELEKKLRAALN